MKILCDICGKEFSKNYRLKKHLIIHSDAKNFLCNECGKYFKLSHHLKRHQKSNCRGNVVQNIASGITNYTYSCPKCPGKVFEKKKSLYSHNSVVHGEKRYKCLKCDKDFVFQSQLSRHQSHHLHTCSICDITLHTFDQYQKHLIIHKVKKPYIQCKICDQNFTKNTYDDHIRLVHKELMYSCNICDKDFQYKRNLVHHIKMHSKDKYACTHENCIMKFRSKVALKWHLEKHDFKNTSDDEKSDKSMIEIMEATKSWRRKYYTDLESI